jgi:hypothetical protein
LSVLFGLCIAHPLYTAGLLSASTSPGCSIALGFWTR